MLNVPNDRGYTIDHEWVLVSPGAGLPFHYSLPQLVTLLSATRS